MAFYSKTADDGKSGKCNTLTKMLHPTLTGGFLMGCRRGITIYLCVLKFSGGVFLRKILDVCSLLLIGDSNPLKIDFIGKGNIWINNTYQQDEIRLAQYIVHQALSKTAQGQLSIWGYDSDLSGIFAPFAALSGGETRMLELISDHKDLQSYLNYAKQQIQVTQNVIQGRADSLIEFRDSIQMPVESYKLIVLSLDMGIIDADTRSKISLLMRNGPKFGISFLIISTTIMSVETSGGREIEIPVQAMAPNITVIEAEGAKVKNAEGNTISYTSIVPEIIIKSCEGFIEKAKYIQLPTIKFTEVNDTLSMWDKSSINGLTFSIGKFGINNMQITIGDEINQRHNAIITGAVGQGKSNLISVIIHSLCQRYSPQELQMYLLDFKEGVTFKSFSNIGQDEYLPHARALGLESDMSFGIAVLSSLYEEYQRRMSLLKENSVKSIKELRISRPDIQLPRILVVIDEFQMMFSGERQEGEKAVLLLEKSVRLFRAAGIHFILASQTLGGNEILAPKLNSIFGQVPIRIALKNSISESQQTLSQNNSAAAFLMPREAIVNLDYGEVSQNRKTIVAFADEKALKPLRTVWWEKARSVTSPPYVFESEKRITVSNSINVMKEARNNRSLPAALIGDKISIDGKPVILPLTDEPGRNIAIIGTPDSDCNQAIGIMQSIAISLAIQNAKGNARFLFCDFERKEVSYDKLYPEFAEIMENAGYFIESIPPCEFEAEIKHLNQQEESDEAVYVFCSVLDRWKFEAEPYGQGSVLKTFVESAPAKKMHFIGWWMKASSFTSQVAGFGNTDAFNSKIFLRSDERTVQSLTNPFVKWSAQSNRALVSDSIEFSEEIIFIPYGPVMQDDVGKFKKQIWDM